MSKQCDLCGFTEPLPFTCKFCGNSFCYNHRLPESHNCPGLVLYKQKIQDTGKLYHYEPEMKVHMRKSSAFRQVNSFLSVLKGNASLAILAVAVISFLLQIIIPVYSFYFALYPVDIFSRPWTLVTHMFLHGGGTHLLFNMLFLYFIGTELERRIGSRQFLTVFMVSGIVAGIGYSLWSIFIMGNPFAAAVGASGALFGVFAALAIIAPHIRLYLFFIPVPVKITHALILFALFDLLFIGSGDPIARSAHLSGVVAGVFIGRHLKGKKQYMMY
ncbi:MAG: rhomboid family intramembrane serine protease [Candidatus Methanoperedenaceae archaeon]|nr:rhomboid family intramembrane serine protease [Candidatus Methanoperedenaceae archaeon]MDW7725735.1 rhomboid family intramembrane serine protease [Candidatus Methanoperedens sp.]